MLAWLADNWLWLYGFGFVVGLALVAFFEGEDMEGSSFAACALWPITLWIMLFLLLGEWWRARRDRLDERKRKP
jgi:hypothetical protein